MSGQCKICNADPSISDKINIALNNGDSLRQVESLALTLGLTITRPSISRHKKNHLTHEPEYDYMGARETETCNMENTQTPLTINPDDVINKLQQSSSTDEIKPNKRLLIDILEQLVINAGLIAHQRMQEHMAGNFRYPNEEIKSLISLVQLSTERPSSTRNPAVSALSERLKDT